MKFLFVHQNFPAQFLHIVRRLAAQRRHEILFLTEQNANFLTGVRKLTYSLPREPAAGVHADAREFEQAMIRAEAVARAALLLRNLGFRPDIIIGHHGWGELLNLCDVWADVPMLGYFEFFYRIEGLDVGFDPEFPTNPALFPSIRAKNMINHLALDLGGEGQTPTRFQQETYPAWARERIRVLPEGADLSLCRPDASAALRPFTLGAIRVAPEETLITYVARDLEPYRGVHVMLRALPALLAARPKLRVILVGGDGVSYGARLARGNWREYFLAQLRGRIDERRVHFPGRIDHADYLRLLQRSDAHVYLTYPFVASWSLREALACGCAVVGSDTAPVREFITHGENGLLTPFHAPDKLAETVLHLLETPALASTLRKGARAYAERHLAMQQHFEAFEATIARLTGQAMADGG